MQDKEGSKMNAKKQYVKAEAEILRFDTKDIITLSGFFGQEVSFSKKRDSKTPTIGWDKLAN